MKTVGSFMPLHLETGISRLVQSHHCPLVRKEEMGYNSAIEWCDATWTPIRARKIDNGKIGVHCERVSVGCTNCYSATFNRRRLPNQGTGLDFVRGSRDKVEIFLDDKILAQPLHWRKPKRIFVCSQTDLFAEFVPDEFIDKVFAVMALCPQHTFQILTKRPERMMGYVTQLNEYGTTRVRSEICGINHISNGPWPLPNVWLGVSVENKETLHRIETLKDTPAAVRFVSFEPLLEDLGALILDGIHWAIIGGESGSGARPMHFGWVRSLTAQCNTQNVAVFVKQLGRNPMFDSKNLWPLDIDKTNGGDWTEWPPDLRVREYPTGFPRR